MPKDHMSSCRLMGCLRLLLESRSGAMYSRVPESDGSIASSLVTSPKSPRMICPWSSTSMLSGLRSR